MKHYFSRRQFLATAGAAATTVLGSSIFKLDTVWAAPHVRRNLGGMSASDPVLASYRKAIRAMKLIPGTHPLSWDYQAAIYGTTLPGAHTAWHTRQLGNHFFWSWHRMYLYWFERIVRKMSGESSFALPFWDYELPAQRTLHAAFRDPASELYTHHRGPGWNTGSASFPRSHVDSSAGMAIGGPGLEGRAFFTAGEVIEQNPHNNVHVDIGGWMASPLTAAQDPVFYVHASNIDRLWNLWMTKGGVRYDPLFLDVWKNRSYTFFDENGSEVHMTGCDVMRCAEQLNYAYEGEPPQIKEYCHNPLPAFSTETWQLAEGPAAQLTAKEVAVPISLAPIRKPRSEWLQNLPSGLQPNQDAFLALNFHVQADSEPGAVWEVYLGLQSDQPANSDSPHFLGTVSLYSRGIRSAADRFHSHAGEQLEVDHFLFPAARALEAALKSGVDRVFVRFVPTGPLIDGKPSQPRVLAAVQTGPVNLSLCWAQEPHE